MSNRLFLNFRIFSQNEKGFLHYLLPHDSIMAFLRLEPRALAERAEETGRISNSCQRPKGGKETEEQFLNEVGESADAGGRSCMAVSSGRNRP